MSRSHLSLDPPFGPPPEVLEEVAAAWERAQEPLLDELLLDFASEPALGRAWGELRLVDGALVERISASEAIAIACGDAVLLPAPAMAV
ncbi:MAG: hypothetical protein ACRDPC_26025 [Solirubrobacteraceae bacterium]